MDEFLFRRMVERSVDLAVDLFRTTEIACFQRGTRIETAEGLVAVEDLRDGTLIATMDHGLQPVRRVLSKAVAGTGRLAPVVIGAGVLGNGRALRVSARHRMVVAGWRADLLTGAPEVLAAAGDLVDGVRVRIEAEARVEYFHLLFDRHEIIFAEGAASESYNPFAQDAETFAPGLMDEVRAIFPGIGSSLWDGTLLGGTARPCATAAEASLLLCAG